MSQFSNPTQAVPLPKPPAPGEETGSQGTLLGPGLGPFIPGGPSDFGGGASWGYGGVGSSGSGASYAGGGAANPCGFQGWGSYYYGFFWTYRFMLDHFKIAHVRAKVLNAIVDSEWEAKPFDDAVPKEWVDWVKDTLVPKRRDVMKDQYRGVDMGFAPAEKVWEIENGQYVFQYSKPLLVDWTRIVADGHGRFAGLNQGQLGSLPTIGTDLVVSGKAVAGLDTYKSWIYTYDQEAGNLYGRSRLENIRRSCWGQWLDVAQQLLRLGYKVSGVQAIFKVPGGTFKDKDGKDVSYREDVVKHAIPALVNGQGICLTNLSLQRNSQSGNSNKSPDPEMLALLAKTSLVEVDVIDFGNQTPAITGLLARLEHLEDGMVEGYLHSPREVDEAKQGGRADAEEHGDSGTLDPQMIVDDIDESFNKSVVDDALELRFGPEARGKVRVETPPLRDAKKAAARTMLTGMMQSCASVQARLPDMLGDKGMGDLLTEAGFNPQKTWSEAEPEESDMPPGGMNGGLNGNGDGNGKLPPKNQNGKNGSDRTSLSRIVPYLDDLFMDALVLDRSAVATEEGEWRTINGAHVLIKDGVAVEGPKGAVDAVNGKKQATPRHLVGKTPEEIEQHGKAPTKEKAGYHAIERDATGDYVGTKNSEGQIKYVAEHAERLQKTKAQPGHADVYLSHDPDAKAPVIGTDSKGRTQAPRSEAATKEAKANKFSRNEQFHAALPAIREKLKADLHGPKGEEAAVLSLIDKTGFRIGGDDDTGAAVKAYGASTLNHTHVKIEGSKVHFDFVGKKGVQQSHVIDDPELASMLGPRVAKGGNLFDTNDAKTGKYLKEIAGNPDFKNKDFRTEVATETARKTMQSMPVPSTIAELKKARAQVAEAVSAKLGNNPDEAQKSYINPKVYKTWHAQAANREQAQLIVAHAKANGMSEADAAKDWIGKHAAAYREKFNKAIK